MSDQTPIEKAAEAALLVPHGPITSEAARRVARAALTAALDHPDLGPMIRDWRMSSCEHYRGTDICSPCLRDLLKEWMLDG